MKAYCINLDRRPDRLAHMTAEFARAGIPFERIPAVDSQDPVVATAAKTIPLSFQNTRISAGAYACLQSHRLAWRRMLEEGQDFGAIFEDDVFLAADMAPLFDEAWIPPDADVIKLETFRVRVHLSRRRQRIDGGWELAQLLSTQFGSAAYVLRADCAKRLLTWTQESGDPVDEVLFNRDLGFAGRSVIYQMTPAPAIQGDRIGPDKQKAATGWQATSITARHAVEQTAVKAGSESTFAKLRRRLREEGRALRLGTRYVVVPHGLPSGVNTPEQTGATQRLSSIGPEASDGKKHDA